MITSIFYDPQYLSNPESIAQKTRNYVEYYLDLTNASALETAVKVITYATLLIPLIALAIRECLRCCTLPVATNDTPQAPQGPIAPSQEHTANPNAFGLDGYWIGPDGGEYNLTNATVRPANLFFNTLLGDNQTTLPGSGEPFKILFDHSEFHKIFSINQERIAMVTAGDGVCAVGDCEIPLKHLYGENTFAISFKELRSILHSHAIISSSVPLLFYVALKRAMSADGISSLSGTDGTQLINLQHPTCRRMIEHARANWEAYGFASQAACDFLVRLSIPQLAALVVKSEDYYLFTDPNGMIRARAPDTNDAIRLISACDIRALRAPEGWGTSNRTIMKTGLMAVLAAAESGYLVIPALEGVRNGDLEFYWEAFISAVLAAPSVPEKIFVNPRHQPTSYGTSIEGCTGEEFQGILDAWRLLCVNDAPALARLDAIINLYERNPDPLQLSQQLKGAFPGKVVSLLNETDPASIFEDRVGGNVNVLSPANTTEEIYTALGTHGLCFETITGVYGPLLRNIETLAANWLPPVA